MQVEDSELCELVWAPPGPGQWICEASHFPRPVSATVELIFHRLSSGAMRGACARYGLPIDGFTFRIVNGFPYSTLDLVADAELASREEAAGSALDEALQAVDVVSLGDGALATHLAELVEALLAGALLHFDLHLADMIPTGRLLVASRALGLPDTVVLDALVGCSPASRPGDDLVRIASVLRGAPTIPQSLEEVAELGDDVAGALAPSPTPRLADSEPVGRRRAHPRREPNAHACRPAPPGRSRRAPARRGPRAVVAARSTATSCTMPASRSGSGTTTPGYSARGRWG